MFTDLLGVISSWSLWFVTQWWFYPAAVLYMLFGAWFGVLNYWVAMQTDEYPYWLRFVLYPISTVIREGWLFIRGDLSPSFCARDYVVVANMISDETAYPEAASAIVYGCTWPFKILINLVVIGAIYVVSTLTVVFALILFELGWTLDLFLSVMVSVIYSFPHFLLRVVRPAPKVEKT